jgi:hypothetical protein
MSSNSNPYWYKLIKLLKSNGTITTGLTIPFIFGAYKILGQPFSNIKQLIEHIYDSEIDKYPVIQKCPVIGQHVVMVEKKEICNKDYRKDVRLENPNNQNILFISANTDLGKTFDKVCSNLTVKYENAFVRKEFSWNNKEKRWQQFKQLEVETILGIK